jgi:hypothetical protein
VLRLAQLEGNTLRLLEDMLELVGGDTRVIVVVDMAVDTAVVDTRWAAAADNLADKPAQADMAR